MVGTIRPLVYRDRQLFHWGIAANLHALGNIIAAVALGLGLGLIGQQLVPFSEERWTLLFGGLGVLSLAYALDEVGILRLPHPQRAKQVPASWRALFHPYITALLYGLGLGNGIATRIVTGALYIVLWGLFLYAHPLYAAVTFGLFGLGRGVSVLVVGWSMRSLQSGEEVGRAFQKLVDQQDRAHALAGIVMAIFGGYWAISLFLTLS